MDMCISLSREIIKHPFATCPGHHYCCLLSGIHPIMVILAAKLILHKPIISIGLEPLFVLCDPKAWPSYM